MRIAVVGMSLKYPSANNKKEFHKLLSEGKAAPTDNQQIRGDLLGISNYEKVIRNIRLIEDVDKFDNNFFGLVTPEAREMPVEMRLSLQYSAKAIMDAGYSIKDISQKNCGAVVAHSSGTYSQLLDKTTFLSFFNNMPGMTCGYLAHYLKLTGPVYHIDSTCSSSLTAVVDACNHLIMEQADVMIAGGVQICLPTSEQEGKDMQVSALSLGSNQQCIPFDKNANGFYNGEGVGFVLLKRYKDAEKDGDHIYGVIRGYGMYSNSDRVQTMYAPDAYSQNKATNIAWKMAGITCEDITEIEAHGSATKQGDAAEIANLALSLRERKNPEKVYLTAVKSNFGHTACASGITSLLKVLSGFEKNMVYPIAGFSEPNPTMDFEAIHIEPIDHFIEFSKEKRRIAEIGSYGLNEMNVHLIVENYIDKRVKCFSSQNERNKFLKCSARSEAILCEYLRCISQEIIDCNEKEFENIIYTLNVGRDDFNYRCFIKFSDKAELISKLNDKEQVKFIKCKPLKKNLLPESLSLLESDYLAGNDIDWTGWYSNSDFMRVSATVYPFAKKSIWPVIKKAEK